jgi:hypothetical protein
MQQIKRYNIETQKQNYPIMVEDNQDGHWVRYSDYLNLKNNQTEHPTISKSIIETITAIHAINGTPYSIRLRPKSFDQLRDECGRLQNSPLQTNFYFLFCGITVRVCNPNSANTIRFRLNNGASREHGEMELIGGDNSINISVQKQEKPLYAVGFEEAIIGIDDSTNRIIYSVTKCVEVISKYIDGCTELEAIEYFYHNVCGAYVGPKTPIWCQDGDYENVSEIINKHLNSKQL